MTFWYLRYPMGIIRYPHQMEEFTTYNTYIHGSHLAEVTLMPKLSCPNRLRGLDLSGNKGCFFFPGVMPYVCRQCACDKVTQNISSCSLRKKSNDFTQIKVHNLQYLSMLQFCKHDFAIGSSLDLFLPSKFFIVRMAAIYQRHLFSLLIIFLRVFFAVVFGP